MVSYQTLTSIAFDVAKAKGAQFDGQRPENAETIIEIVSEQWNDNKQQWKQYTEAQARERLEDVIEVV